MNPNDFTAPEPSTPNTGSAGPTPPSGELRSGDAFGSRILGLVSGEMRGQLAAGSVDEWHHPLLDPKVSSEVAVEIAEIEKAGNLRRVHLEGQLASEQWAITGLEQRAKEAADMVTAAQVQVARAESQLLARAGDADDQGGPARLAQVHAQVAELRDLMAAARQRLDAGSASTLREEIGMAKAQIASADRRIKQQERKVAQARQHLEHLTAARQTGSIRLVDAAGPEAADQQDRDTTDSPDVTEQDETIVEMAA